MKSPRKGDFHLGGRRACVGPSAGATGASAGAFAGRRDQDAGSSSGLRMPRSSGYGMLISGSPCA